MERLNFVYCPVTLREIDWHFTRIGQYFILEKGIVQRVMYFLFLKYFEVISFLLKRWFFDAIQNKIVALTFFKMSYNFFFLQIDKGFLEFFGPFGLNQLTQYLSIKILKIHNLRVDIYFSIILILFFFAVL